MVGVDDRVGGVFAIFFSFGSGEDFVLSLTGDEFGHFGELGALLVGSVRMRRSFGECVTFLWQKMLGEGGESSSPTWREAA